MVRSSDRWFWVIPLSDTKTSIGVVTDTATFKALRLSPAEMLDQSFEKQPHFREILEGATRVTPVYSTGDYSYRNTRLVGPRWMLAGDAAGFIDPVFSTGVFLAISSGEQCADAIHAALQKPSRASQLFARYEKRHNRVMDLYLRFVTAWYQHEFIEVISAPTAPFRLPAAINAILAGNIYGGFSIWWRMQVFYLFVFLQKFATLVPRLTLTPPSRHEQPATAACAR